MRSYRETSQARERGYNSVNTWSPLLILNAETRVFCSFKEPGTFKLTQKTSAIISDVLTVRLVPLSTPLFSGLTVPFYLQTR
jgi:hypothetical protein